MNLIPWRNKSRALATREPQHPLATFRDEVEQMFEQMRRDPWSLANFGERAGVLSPQLEMSETDSDVTVRAELPGLKPEDFELNVTGNTLRLTGEKRSEHREKHRGTVYSECAYGTFERTLRLPADVDAEHVDAQYKDGVLTVTIPKRADARPKKIAVRNA